MIVKPREFSPKSFIVGAAAMFIIGSLILSFNYVVVSINELPGFQFWRGNVKYQVMVREIINE